MGFSSITKISRRICCPAFDCEARSLSIAKYNQLLRIEQELGDKAEYGGKMR
jgi:enolase